MKKRVTERSYPLPQISPIQCFHGKQLLLYTPLAKFYLELGLELTNITKFIQYQKSFVFDSFVDKITSGRISARKADNPSLELAYKVIGNRLDSKIILYEFLLLNYFSSYGKLGENVRKYSKIALGDDHMAKKRQKVSSLLIS